MATKKTIHDTPKDESTTGAGGELHQTVGGDRPVLTTQQGTPVSDDQNSLRIGARGPTNLKISFSARSSSISIMSAYLSVWFMHGGMERMGTSKTTSR